MKRHWYPLIPLLYNWTALGRSADVGLNCFGAADDARRATVNTSDRVWYQHVEP
jgi:hypothetical protein